MRIQLDINKIVLNLAFFIAVLITLLILALSTSAYAEQDGAKKSGASAYMSNKTRNKVYQYKAANYKAKNNGENKDKKWSDKTITTNCSINIGNIIDSDKSWGASPRENTVVIEGDVINLGKCHGYSRQ